MRKIIFYFLTIKLITSNIPAVLATTNINESDDIVASQLTNFNIIPETLVRANDERFSHFQCFSLQHKNTEDCKNESSFAYLSDDGQTLKHLIINELPNFSYAIDLDSFRAGEKMDFSKGASNHAGEYLYNEDNVCLNFSDKAIKMHSCLIESDGDISFILSNGKLTEVFLRSGEKIEFIFSHQKCPFERMTVRPANSQSPVILTLMVNFSNTPLIVLEALNVTKIDCQMRKQEVVSKQAALTFQAGFENEYNNSVSR